MPPQGNDLHSIGLGSPPAPPSSPRGAGWIAAHPYLAGAAAIAGLLLIGGVFIFSKSSTAPQRSDAGAWGGANLQALDTTSYGRAPIIAQAPDSIMEQIQSATPYTYVPPAAPDVGTSNNGEDANANVGTAFDFDAFVKSLSGGTKTQSSGPPSGSDGSLSDAYSFLPQGLVSTAAPEENRSDLQQKLYDYGNETGSYVQSFEDLHFGMAQTLKNQAEDRSDPQKAAAVVSLAKALKNVGQNLMDMDTIPDQALEPHLALAKSYIQIGKNLELIPAATSDEDFLARIQTYDNSVDEFGKNYVALASFFEAYAVKFNQTDPGSVFAFTPIGL
jgi:hypothetical protein